MRAVSRQEIERLLLDQAVLTSELVQDATELRVLFHLGNGDVCIIRYDRSAQKKEYWIDTKPPARSL